MPQHITVSSKAMVEEAEREIETLAVEDAIKLHGRDDVVLVDIRDPRELSRDGKVPGAFHCTRGMLEFSLRSLGVPAERARAVAGRDTPVNAEGT